MTIVVCGSMVYAVFTQNYTLLFWAVIAYFMVFSVGLVVIGLVRDRLTKSKRSSTAW